MSDHDLFHDESVQNDGSDRAPLAERLRPRSLEEFVGQRRLLAPGMPLRRLIEEGKVPSMILWGPPGSGKTTLARLLANHTGLAFESFSAVLSGVKEVREVVERARSRRRRDGQPTLLFVDEIHRFNKAQQDAFLPHVEDGLLVLVGSTTENPSFEVNAALLSRVTVFTLDALEETDLEVILERALTDPERGVRGRDGEPLRLTGGARELLVGLAGGDARTLLNLVEMAAGAATGEVDDRLVDELLRRRTLRHDKAGESHYNLISALHKAVRGSDVDGALYWLARLLEGGEDPLFVARRVVRMAVEDVGLADPKALGLALDAKDCYHFLGTPEGEIALFQAVAYLAVAPKSNAAYLAEKAARRAARDEPPYPVPLPIRNAPTRLMKDLGYAHGYLYDHDWPGALAPQTYLPDELTGRRFYEPTDRGLEARLKDRLEWLRRRRAELLAAEGTAERGRPETTDEGDGGETTP
jgi:putative ATPase